MGMSGSKPKAPKIPEAKPAARRPERVVDVKPEDVEIGSKVTDVGGDVARKGKRSLTRPSGGGISGLRV